MSTPSSSASTPPMKTYRVFCFDEVRGDLTNDLIEAATDEEAISHANAMGFGTKCELWEGDRLVAQLEARAA